MSRLRYHALLTGLSASIACRSPAPTSITAADSTAVHAAFDSLWAGIGALDADRALAVYDTAPDFAYVLQGDLVRGRPAYDALLRSIFPSVRTVENHVDSLHFVTVGPNAMVVVASYHEQVTLRTGTRVAQRGAWSNLFVRRPTGWKVLFGHTTDVQLPTSQ